MKKALITGIAGQDGSYLAEFLLSKKYKVFGVLRKNQNIKGLENIKNFNKKVSFVSGDIADNKFVSRCIKKIKPDEIYHLAAQSNSNKSFDSAIQTMRLNTESTYMFLAAAKEHSPKSKFFFAGSSEMFGRAKESPQNERTAFDPVNPYGVSKVAGFSFVKMFRDIYGVFACTGILFNHESSRRGKDFVTRKITLAVSNIKSGKQKELRLGNLDIKRDWGGAQDYVQAMWLMLQAKKPKDFVVGTGEEHSLKEFLDVAFNEVKLNWKDYVVVDPLFFRPVDIWKVVADPSLIKKELGWKRQIKFKDMVRTMVREDLKKTD